MKISGIPAAIATLATASTQSSAQEINYLAGVDFTSNYVVNGASDSNDKPALKAWFSPCHWPMNKVV